MEYNMLGSTDLKISRITLGTWAIGGAGWGHFEKEEAKDAIAASLAHGVTSIDTAPFYGLGSSEELIGEVIKGKDRTNIQILSKVGLVWDGSNQGKGEYFFDHEQAGKTHKVYKYAGKNSIKAEVEASLKRLDTDYIDLLQLHWPDSTTSIEETMKALDGLIKDGKVRAVGVCNYDAAQMEEAQKYCTLSSNQVKYNMLERGIEKAVIPHAKANNVSIIAYSPLERGLLSGKYLNLNDLAATDHRKEYFKEFDVEQVNIMLAKIKPIADQKGSSLSQLVLRWTTLQSGITAVLAGARNKDQALANATALNVFLSDQEKESIAGALVDMKQA